MERYDILREELREELLSDILPYWMKLSDPVHGGYYGQVDNRERLVADAPKGAIYTARILWTFSAAYRIFKKEEYLEAAARAKDFILTRMIDPVHGGAYWSVERDGTPADTKKQIYVQGFMIYGLSEYYRATGDGTALDAAVELFRLVEKYAHDAQWGGYVEAMTCDWQPIADMRLSDKDDNEPKTMNTHLHILEPYANLLRVWDDDLLRERLKELVVLFIDKIVDPVSGHCRLFFGMNWKCKSSVVSYGHDIEAFWLIRDAMDVLGDYQLEVKYSAKIKNIALAAHEGILPDGSLAYEKEFHSGRMDTERHWWVQAENMIGNFYLYRYFGDRKAMDKVVAAWEYIKGQIIDRENGEWIWSRLPDGTPNIEKDKAGFWKCPYHNGRMCMAIYEAALSV